MVIEENGYTSFPISRSNYADDATLSHILGGERDIQLLVDSGDYYLKAIVEVSN